MDERQFIINEGHVGNRIVSRLWTWDEFKQRAMQSVATGETHDEYMKIFANDKGRATKIKDVGGFVAGDFSQPIRQNKYLVSRSMITLDIERQEKKANKKPDVTAIIGRLKGKAYAVFSTHKHTADDPRVRVILPLLYDIPKENYSLVAGMIAQSLGVSDCLDVAASAKTAHQIMFWSSHPKDIQPYTSSGDGELWDPADYTNESDRSVTRAKKQMNPAEKPGPIGVFCRAYKDRWPELVTNYDLPYEEKLVNRWKYTEASSGAGVIVYSDGLFINSFHATDPANGMNNFYDVVRKHKFAGMDKQPPEGDLSRCGERETLKAITSDPIYQKQLKKEQNSLPAGTHDVALDFGGGDDKKAMKDLLFEEIMDLHPEFFRTSSDSYMDIEEKNGRVKTILIGSREYKNFARRLFRKKHEKIPNESAVKEAAEQLIAEASAFPKQEVYLRVAQVDQTIYYDLCNEQQQVVKIDASGWSVINKSPVKFIRSDAMNPLPVPEKGGNIDELREFLNPDTEADFKLFVGGLLSCMQNAGGDYFILAINGPEGSGKSTMSKIARLLVDPSDAGLMAVPEDEKEFGLQSAGNWFPMYDNLSRVSGKLSDAFCKLVTGASFQKKKLYTDTDLITVKYKRPVLINGIPDLGGKPDFIDRLIRVRTKSLKQARRPKVYGKGGIMNKFMAARPRILGSLFDAIACALRNVENVVLNRSIRSVDAAMFVTAAESSLGWSGHDFEDAVYMNQHESQDDALERNVFVRQLEQFMKDKPVFRDTATQIINKLSTGLSLVEQKYFPHPENLKTNLQKEEETLRDHLGIVWHIKPHNRIYVLENLRYSKTMRPNDTVDIPKPTLIYNNGVIQ